MSGRWSDLETLKLIELYKSYNYLWDTTRSMYKNAAARKAAYEVILDRLKRPDLTVQDVKSKIKNLRSTYYHEYRRIEIEGRRQTRQLLWYNAMKPVMKHVSTVLKPASDNELSEEDEEMPNADESRGEEKVYMDSYTVSLKQEFLDGMENQDTCLVDDNCFEPAEKQRKVAEYYEEDETHETNDNIIVLSNNITKKSKPKKADEFQMFSNNIAAQLRSLPLERALNIQIEIQTMVANARIEILNKSEETIEEEGQSS